MSDYIITQIRQADKYGNHLVDELLAAEGIRRDANLDYTCGMYDDEMIDFPSNPIRWMVSTS